MGDELGSPKARELAARTHSGKDTVNKSDQAARQVVSSSSSCSAAAAGQANPVDISIKDACHSAAAQTGKNSANRQQPDQNNSQWVVSSSNSSNSVPLGPLPESHVAIQSATWHDDGCIVADGSKSSTMDQIQPLSSSPQLPGLTITAAATGPVAAATGTSNDDFVVIDLSRVEDVTDASPEAAAAAAAAPSSSSSSSNSRLHYMQQQLCTASQQRSIDPAALARHLGSLTDLDRCSTGLSSSQLPGQRECRICLAADLPDDIVQPCSCSGTVQYAHLECLKAWVAERCSLECELCGKQYRDEVRKQLEPLIDPRKRRARQRNAMRTIVGGSIGDSAVTVEHLDTSSEEDSRPQISWTRFWIHLGILIMLLVAVLYLSLFVNVGSSDNFWLMFLWRAITVILPLFLIIRCVAALYTWRQQYIASRR